VQIYAKTYNRDNPEKFNMDEDIPYILTYSILQLNSFTYNEKVEKQYKLTREMFIKNTSLCARGKISTELLNGIYNRIIR